MFHHTLALSNSLTHVIIYMNNSYCCDTFINSFQKGGDVTYATERKLVSDSECNFWLLKETTKEPPSYLIVLAYNMEVTIFCFRITLSTFFFSFVWPSSPIKQLINISSVGCRYTCFIAFLRRALLEWWVWTIGAVSFWHVFAEGIFHLNSDLNLYNRNCQFFEKVRRRGDVLFVNLSYLVKFKYAFQNLLYTARFQKLIIEIVRLWSIWVR